tara:strand:+ start:71 stop:739 length:669 start_codon:yes stop_codon:yes gene_type:complete
MQARYYDPVIGRFYSNDPVGFMNIHTFNRYAYVNNNPYKYVDPFGMASEEPNVAERQEAKRRKSCQEDPNCSYFRMPSGQSIRARWGKYPQDQSGNPAPGQILCNNSCQKAAVAWSKITADEVIWGVMMRNYYQSQSDVADGLAVAGASFYAPWTTASYALISDVTRTRMSIEGLLMSVGISKAMSPVVKYLGTGSSISTVIWEYNAWWLGNGLGFVPVGGD